MSRYFAAALLAVAVAAPAEAAITTGAFVTRARALQALGPAALVSPDLLTLKDEAQAATAELKADREARLAAGKRPIACVPEGTSIGITDMIDGLEVLSPAEKALPLKDGYAHVLARRYPCR